jgi:hypothetical protein
MNGQPKLVEVLTMSKENLCCTIRTCFGVAAAGMALCATAWLSGCANTTHSKGATTLISTNQPAPATLGYIWDSRVQGLRGVAGMPGAAHLESALAGLKVSAASPCSRSNFALIADAEGALFVLSLPSGQLTRIADRVAANQRIVLSPACSTAIAYAPGASRAFLIGELPSSPRVQAIEFPTQSVTDAVVSETGSLLVASKNGDGTVTVQLVLASGAAQTLETLRGYGAMAFAPSADTAVIADAGSNIVVAASQLSSKPVVTQIAGMAQGVLSPRAAAVSADGQFAFIANGTGGTVLRFNLGGPPALKAIKCACSPTELIPLFGNATFQITDPAAGTIYALEGDTKEMRTVFIPTDKVGTAAGGAQ